MTTSTALDERQLRVAIDQVNMPLLSKSQYQLHVAKSVLANGKLVFNTVWRSKTLSPFVDIKWKPVYAFNWTEDVPSHGISITAQGDWMQCNVGQAVDIAPSGFFTTSSTPADPSSMMIGVNNYRSQNKEGIRIIIGVQNAAGTFDPVFVDPDSIPLNATATFQPQEQIQWWYESGSKQGTVFTKHATKIESANYSAPDPATKSWKKQSTFDYNEGTWTTTVCK
ncbi:hypothetical protein N7540_004728 [Penicillium herquei]|nr:hypothetical protein N7540_004728 [Penicillium herquei]